MREELTKIPPPSAEAIAARRLAFRRWLFETTAIGRIAPVYLLPGDRRMGLSVKLDGLRR